MDQKYLAALQQAYEAWFERYDLGPKMVIETEVLDYLADVFDRQDLVTAIDAVLGGRAQAFAPDPRQD